MRSSSYLRTDLLCLDLLWISFTIATRLGSRKRSLVEIVKLLGWRKEILELWCTDNKQINTWNTGCLLLIQILKYSSGVFYLFYASTRVGSGRVIKTISRCSEQIEQLLRRLVIPNLEWNHSVGKP